MPRKRRIYPKRTGLSIRVDLESGLRIDPDKIALLETIAATGSISAAGRTLGISYKRAWDLVAELNRRCTQTVVSTSPGGRAGGGTTLTSVGEALIRLYREIERASHDASEARVRALSRLSPSQEEAAQPALSRAVA